MAVAEQCDVYSFGVVVLETIMGSGNGMLKSQSEILANNAAGPESAKASSFSPLSIEAKALLNSGSVTRIDFSSSRSLPNWTSLPNLEYLNRSNCFSTGSVSVLDKISTLSKLMYLDLSYNYYLQDIGKLSNLVEMYMSNNILSGPIPPEIGHLTQLAHLDLSHNFLIGKVPSSIGQLINLNFLDVSANQINDNIPPELGHFPSKIQYLDLSKSLLSGPIPKELQQLCYLELGSKNGTIPVGLAYLPRLKQNLSHNYLSGKVSYCLCNLIVRDFSYNLLEGQISELAYTMIVTEKCDVYSFEVVLVAVCMVMIIITALALPKSSSVSPSFSSSMEAKALLDSGWWGNISSRYHCEFTTITCNEAGSVIRVDLSYDQFLRKKLDDLNWSSLPNLQLLVIKCS
ncbi:putative leucine-rich repeat receptor-like protein kinase [Camellia lanceoleosa]|uniref:Leucine-rich repeat receptor-like protein kinase n=1 Tax=Camellia lanceoleosa TaxID=1840588 RepID=A0ACC0IXF7_9ERIC|nr:putative leucine-rich repeat receptor-like protein kinase [Camellia lanceoleosa]